MSDQRRSAAERTVESNAGSISERKSYSGNRVFSPLHIFVPQARVSAVVVVLSVVAAIVYKTRERIVKDYGGSEGAVCRLSRRRVKREHASPISADGG